MSYLKHKVSLPQNLEDLEDGDGASAIYVGDTKIIPANIAGLGQRVRKPGIPYFLDCAVREWLRIWCKTNDYNDFLTINADIPANWTDHNVLIGGTPGDAATGTYSTNIGAIFNATGMTPWGMGTLNDGWGYVSDPSNRFDITKYPNGDIWTELEGYGTSSSRTIQCLATIARGSTDTGSSWWDAGDSTTDMKRQLYATRVLYRLAAFEAGLFMDHPQSLWTTVLTDSQLRLLASTITTLIGGPGLPNYRWITDTNTGKLSLESTGGVTSHAKISDLFTDSTLQPLGEPRTVWDYVYSASGTEVFNIAKTFTQKSLDDGDSLELSNALNTTHQVIWLTPEMAFSPTGTIKFLFRSLTSGYQLLGYVEAKWMVDPSTSQTQPSANVNAGFSFVKWEDSFLITETHTMGDAAPWDRFVVGYRRLDGGETLVPNDYKYNDDDGISHSLDRAIAIGIIVPKDFSTEFMGSIEVTRDGVIDIIAASDGLVRVNGVW